MIHRVPTRQSAAVFTCKAWGLRLRRTAQDVAAGVKRHARGEAGAFPQGVAESRTPLWTEETVAERALQLGKVQNLRVALRSLDGVTLPAGEVFSFWKQVGRATRGRGYVDGRMLREGCLMPAVGGGLCQLSNALYDVALQAGCGIVERHPHSAVVPGSAAARGRDATVAWNYIDLRFRPRQPLLIEARLTRDELVLRLRSATPPPLGFIPLTTLAEADVVDTRAEIDVQSHSCGTCAVDHCFRHAPEVAQAGTQIGRGRTAFLVDERWPEFERYLTTARTAEDLLGIPLDGARWRQSRHRWDTSGYARVGTATGETLWRAVTSRRLGRYGAARLQAQLSAAEALAARLARLLAYDVTDVCVAQSLLPFLWRAGHLGGRQFRVLMTRLPLETLHVRLDAALALHPDRATLGEFRAPEWIAAAEADALAAADQVITPHCEIADLFPGRALRLDWQLPHVQPAPGAGRVIAFPGPTAARKGAYELRTVARQLDLEVLLLGSELEGEGFWNGVRTRRAEGDWRREVAAVVQPALVEEKPRPLLAAIAAGVPVIATNACGLAGLPGVTTVPVGDEGALATAVARLLADAERMPANCSGSLR